MFYDLNSVTVTLPVIRKKKYHPHSKMSYYIMNFWEQLKIISNAKIIFLEKRRNLRHLSFFYPSHHTRKSMWKRTMVQNYFNCQLLIFEWWRTPQKKGLKSLTRYWIASIINIVPFHWKKFNSSDHIATWVFKTNNITKKISVNFQVSSSDKEM